MTDPATPATSPEPLAPLSPEELRAVREEADELREDGFKRLPDWIDRLASEVETLRSRAETAEAALASVRKPGSDGLDLRPFVAKAQQWIRQATKQDRETSATQAMESRAADLLMLVGEIKRQRLEITCLSLEVASNEADCERLESQRDVLQVEKDGAVKRGMLLLDSQNHWVERATKAEAERDEARRERDTAMANAAETMHAARMVEAEAIRERDEARAGYDLAMQDLAAEIGRTRAWIEAERDALAARLEKARALLPRAEESAKCLAEGEGDYVDEQETLRATLAALRSALTGEGP